jgi:Methyltransferase domain
LKSLLSRTAIGIFRAVPVKAARHLLFLAQSKHDLLDRWGYHIRPVHYYEPLPDFSSITRDQIDRRRDYPALDFNWTEQLDLVHKLGTSYNAEIQDLANGGSNGFEFDNGFFAGFDAAVYYSLIRHLKPRRVVEVGAGYSTRIAQKALIRNRREGAEGRLQCIEPYPEPRLTEALPDVPLITKPVQETGLDLFASLQRNDVLFIDSSHTVKFDSDVCYLFLEVLPALNAGVWVHVHDVFFPNDYPAEWLLERRLALNEQYLLEAFLAFNTEFSIRLANRWICLDHPEASATIWPGDRSANISASGFWMKRNE